MRQLLNHLAPQPVDPSEDLPAEAIAVRIRWFGLGVGALIVNLAHQPADPTPLNAILLLGLAYTALDTLAFYFGRVFLKDVPLVVSAMEALFIGLLCYFEAGLDSVFRFYYLLSLLCCAMRHRPRITVITFAFDVLSYGTLYASLPAGERDVRLFALMLVILAWVTWAVSALTKLLKGSSERLRLLNAKLRENQTLLETRITERTLQLQESQAQVLHQEKMAAFGLLAAGIAHEVGNPLTAISNLVQMLERRELDDDMREKLGHVRGQLVRIQSILRELVTFSRPASDQRGRVAIAAVVAEALGIAKYYKGGKSRTLASTMADELPMLIGVRDQLVQVVFNLVLNAIDATGKGGRIEVACRVEKNHLLLSVEDDGAGIPESVRDRLFRPYFTTKKHGTGLGLFVLKKIIEEHGGSVLVDSEPSCGTTFTIALPIPEPTE